MRCVFYGRYSTDLQSTASIDDQLRVCREFAQRLGWTLIDAYEDRAMSGTTRFRPGYQNMLADARLNKFDVVLAESLDRLSRDQEDIAHLYKQLNYCGIKIHTLSEGAISELHVGLGGTIGAMYVRQLAEKTHRGLRGRIEAGKSGGGLTYGYDVVRTPMPDGSFEVGRRKINLVEADVVRRIFEMYANGSSPRAIASKLNNEDVPGPRGKPWGASTIAGNAARGVGIINNKAYVGKLVWNKLHYQKDPDTGRRRSRTNPPEQVVEKDAPELRIVDDSLWTRVKSRQAQMSLGSHKTEKTPWNSRRPKYLLSGLAKCGSCGGSYVSISQTHWGCATARNKGCCSNRLSIGREKLEALVLSGLKHHLASPALLKEFTHAFLTEVNKARLAVSADKAAWTAELQATQRKLRNIVSAIADGMPARALKDELSALEARENALQARLSTVALDPTVLLHPNLPELYRRRVEGLETALSGATADPETMEAVRALVEKVVLTPHDGKLVIDLHGEIAAFLQISASGKARNAHEQLKVVAGARSMRCSGAIPFEVTA